MKINKLSVVYMLVVAAMSSCSSDSEFNSTKPEYVNSVRVTVEDFIPETPETRTAFTVDNEGFHFQWTDGDALGIYPIGGDQVKFPISAGDGAATASFDGGAWKLRSEYQYAAYYPFSAANYMIEQTVLPVSFTGQTQNGNGSTAHLSKYDYLACAATTPDDNGGVNLSMKHLGAFLRIQLTMPKAATFSSVVLESDGAKFVTEGTFNLAASTPAINPTATSSTYTINLTNVSTTADNQVVTVYAIVAPADLSTSNIKVTVNDTSMKTYVQTVAGKNFMARSAYSISVDNFPDELEHNGHAYVDLGLSVKWATMNVGATAPEGNGDYFAWGDTEPYYTAGHSQDTPCSNWKTSKTGYNWTSYKWCSNGSWTGITKYTYEDGQLSCIWYDNDSFVGDNKKTLELADDAAHVNWGGNWRMPTMAELGELCTNCTWTWENHNDVYGYKVSSKINSNSIFLPAAGYRNNSSLSGVGSSGSYWSSSLMGPGSYSACELGISPVFANTFESDRLNGNQVRAVCP